MLFDLRGRSQTKFTRLSQYYNLPKLKFSHFSNFCRKVSQIDKKNAAHFCILWEVVICKFASRTSPAQKLRGLREVIFQNFSRATFFGRYIFELFARETNLKKRAV